ncbi:MAG: carboxypeptidase regulatory-like domain-containing protein [Acidobacteria bacterium]|nr:carboxypeptidase regulatory-like domain-containing protein [Acidobacteriota bacterium]
MWFLTLLCVAMAWGQTATKPEELCKLDGVVKHAITGEPVRKATLYLQPMDSRGMSIPSTTVTNAEGKFSMKEVEPGQYRFYADKPGFVRTPYGATPMNRQGTTVTLAKGQAMKDVEFRMQPHAVITGRVLDEDGDPVQYAQVQLMSYRTMQGKRQLMPSGGASTNDLGEYRMFGISPGRYYMAVTHRGSFMMASGVDRSAAQAPDEGFPTTYYPGTVDLTGATQLNIGVGAMLQGVDVPMRKVRTFRLKGRVVGMPSGARGGEVSAVTKGVSEMMMYSMGRNSTAWRPPSGDFEMRGLRPGTYVVSAMFWEGPQNQLAGQETVEIGERDVEGVTIRLGAGVEVSGSVRVDSDVAVTAKLEEINIMLNPVQPAMRPTPTFSKVQQDGAFRMTNAIPDSYNLRIWGMPPEFYLKSVRMGEVDVLENGLTVTGSAVAGMEVVVSPKAAEVTGTVVNKDGKMLPGAGVVLQPLFGKSQRLGELLKVVTSDQNGSFRIRGVTPGEYRLYAFEADPSEVSDLDTLKDHEAKAVTLSLKEGAKEMKELKAVVLENR